MMLIMLFLLQGIPNIVLNVSSDYCADSVIEAYEKIEAQHVYFL